MLAASVDNRPHTFLDRVVLRGDAFDPGIRFGLLHLPIIQPAVVSVSQFAEISRQLFGRAAHVTAQLFDVRLRQRLVGVQGLIGGSFDFSQILGATTTAIMRGAALKIVMVFDRRPLFWLFSAPNIKRLNDLKGKVVAIQTLGGASDHMTRELLAKNGIDWQRDVTIQVIPLEARLTALSSGAVAATVVNAPERARANKLGFNELAFYGDHFEYASGGITVTEKTLMERRDFVGRFLRTSLQTLHWYKANEKEAISMFARFSKLPEEDARSIYRASLDAYTEDGTLSHESQERIINFHKNEVKIDRGFSRSEFSISQRSGQL